MYKLNPRKPLVKLADVDYEEMFDEGWEEEPEGESLSVRAALVLCFSIESIRFFVLVPSTMTMMFFFLWAPGRGG